MVHAAITVLYTLRIPVCDCWHITVDKWKVIVLRWAWGYLHRSPGRSRQFCQATLDRQSRDWSYFGCRRHMQTWAGPSGTKQLQSRFTWLFQLPNGRISEKSAKVTVTASKWNLGVIITVHSTQTKPAVWSTKLLIHSYASRHCWCLIWPLIVQPFDSFEHSQNPGNPPK